MKMVSGGSERPHIWKPVSKSHLSPHIRFLIQTRSQSKWIALKSGIEIPTDTLWCNSYPFVYFDCAHVLCFSCSSTVLLSSRWLPSLSLSFYFTLGFSFRLTFAVMELRCLQILHNTEKSLHKPCVCADIVDISIVHFAQCLILRIFSRVFQSVIRQMERTTEVNRTRPVCKEDDPVSSGTRLTSIPTTPTNILMEKEVLGHTTSAG